MNTHTNLNLNSPTVGGRKVVNQVITKPEDLEVDSVYSGYVKSTSPTAGIFVSLGINVTGKLVCFCILVVNFWFLFVTNVFFFFFFFYSELRGVQRAPHIENGS